MLFALFSSFNGPLERAVRYEMIHLLMESPNEFKSLYLHLYRPYTQDERLEQVIKYAVKTGKIAQLLALKSSVKDKYDFTFSPQLVSYLQANPSHFPLAFSNYTNRDAVTVMLAADLCPESFFKIQKDILVSILAKIMAAADESIIKSPQFQSRLHYIMQRLADMYTDTSLLKWANRVRLGEENTFFAFPGMIKDVNANESQLTTLDYGLYGDNQSILQNDSIKLVFITNVLVKTGYLRLSWKPV